MRLPDKITLMAGDTELVTLPAQVGGNRTAAIDKRTTNDFIVVQVDELRAIIKPNSRTLGMGKMYRWNGALYSAPADPQIRMKNGREHHYTITLKRAAE